MGRREKPVDHSKPARGRLAEHLRSWRESAAITYETLAARTDLSPATLKRAASGTTVPKRSTVEAYVDGCAGGHEAVRAADKLWRRARIEERGRLAQLHAPRPELIGDGGDLSRALEVVFEQAGAPSLRDIRDRSGNTLALPVSSAARIVNRDAIPADLQQLRAFLTGCGVPPERHAPWLAAFAKISSQSPAVADDPRTDIQRRVTLRHSRQWLMDRYGLDAWNATQDGSALQPLALNEQPFFTFTDYLRAEARRNGFSADQARSWQPDYELHLNGKHLVLEVKSTANPGPGRGPKAGGAMAPPRTPPGGSSPTAARQARRTSSPPKRSATSRVRQDQASAEHHSV